MKNKIIDLMKTKFSKKGWGKILNYLQDVAEEVLDTEDFNAYLEKANKDQKRTRGADGVLFNGRYFDWREFDTKKYEIVEAFLDYFTENDLQKIYKAI